MNYINKLFENKKGIMAIDESDSTANKRLADVNAEETKENRDKWRELIIKTKDLEKYISALLLFTGTFDQTIDGENYIEIVKRKGILPIVKLDGGLADFNDVEKYTQGLDILKDKARKFKDRGALFTKWRAVFNMNTNDREPSAEVIEKNVSDLVEYAKIIIEVGMTPILEPELLRVGNHSIEEAQVVHKRILELLVQKLISNSVQMNEIIIKTNFTTSGESNENEENAEEVAEKTIETFKALPDDIGGLVFLSGGISNEKSFSFLEASTKLAKTSGIQFPISFCFGRTFQRDGLIKWAGLSENEEDAMNQILKNVEMASKSTH